MLRARLTVSVVVTGALIAGSGASAQAVNPERTLGRWVNRDAEGRRNVILGLAEGLSKRYPNIRVSTLYKCIEDAADSPANWPRDIGPFAINCAENSPPR